MDHSSALGPHLNPQTPERARLFNDPHDDVFGDTMVRVGAQTIADDVSLLTPTADADVPMEVIDRRDWVRMPRRSGSAFRLLVVVFVIGIGSAFVFGRVTSWYDDQLDPPGEPGPALEDGFEISSGAASSEITQNLYAAGVISNPTLFRYWLRDNHSAEFQAGDYVCLEENMSFEETVACLDDGPVPPSLFSVTIPEGLTLDAMIDTLASYGFDKQALRVNLSHALVTADLDGVPDPPLTDTPDQTGSGKEGLLFPDTYQVDLGDKDSDTVARDILALMANEMEDRFETAAAEGTDIVIDELGLTEYEVLTIASLVEKEAQLPAGSPSDRPCDLQPSSRWNTIGNRRNGVLRGTGVLPGSHRGESRETRPNGIRALPATSACRLRRSPLPVNHRSPRRCGPKAGSGVTTSARAQTVSTRSRRPTTNSSRPRPCVRPKAFADSNARGCHWLAGYAFTIASDSSCGGTRRRSRPGLPDVCRATRARDGRCAGHGPGRSTRAFGHHASQGSGSRSARRDERCG